MTDVSRLTDADLVQHYRFEDAIFEFCWEQLKDATDRVNRARVEISRRGLDGPRAPPASRRG